MMESTPALVLVVVVAFIMGAIVSILMSLLRESQSALDDGITRLIMSDRGYRGRYYATKSMLSGKIPDLVALEMARGLIEQASLDLSVADRNNISGFYLGDSLRERWMRAQNLFRVG